MFQQKNCQEKKACLNKYSNRLVFFYAEGIHYSIFIIQYSLAKRMAGRGILLQLLYNKLGSKFGCMINILRESMIIHVKNVQFATCP